MKNKYSIFSLIKNAFSYHENWEKAWKDPEPKKEYDAVIVGGGGHGLATAYYLAKKHNMKNIAVVEKGWIGGGNTGRNTTIIRSNYLWDASAGLYDHALKIWEGLSQELNYNVMFSQRGVMNLAHNLQDVRDLKRRTHANRLNGIDAVYLNTEEVKKFCPIINTSQDIRYPVLGGTLQKRAGTARHDAVAWGYARGADEMGVHIIQNCEVKGIKRNGDTVEGIETTKGFIKTKKIGVVAAGHSSVIANMAGLKLPLESKPLQALVSEPVKPIIDTVVMSNAVHAYVSQSDKGELVIVLKGSEIKSIREGKVNIADSYAVEKNRELILINSHIASYKQASYSNHNPTGERKLLLNKREINKLIGKMNREGFTVIPTKMYFKKGKAKIQLALAKGKKQFDKRATKKNKDWNRDKARYVRKTS